MNIILTDMANIAPFVIPIVPENVKFVGNGANGEVNTFDGRFRTMENQALRNVSWSSFFPVNKNYHFAKAGSIGNGWVYVTFLEFMRRHKLPIRFISTTASKIPTSNMLMTIDEFSYNIDKAGDIVYTLSLTEFPEGFFDFINRDVKVYKYIKNYIKKSDKLKTLKEKGLLSFNNFKNRFK